MAALVLVSSDCHGGAPWEGYRPYLPARYHEEYDAWLLTKYASEEEAKRWRNAFFSEDYQASFNATAELRHRPSDMGWEVPVGDDRARMEQLEGDGVVAEVVFPDGNRDEPPWRGFMDVARYSPELRREGARAWSRWLADLCSERPQQHVGGALIDLHDIDAALAEMRWAKEAGLRGITPGTPPQWLGLPMYGDARYEPIWSASVDLDLPVNFHLGNGGPDVCALLICSGVFERHPRLKVAWTEQGIRWAATLLAELDATFDDPSLRHARAGLSLRPAEYFARNCWLGHSGAHAHDDWDLRFVLGVDRLMWGSDFPHPEGWWPHTTDNLHKCFSGFAEEELRAVLGENAARFYNLDVELLSRVAEPVGPQVAEVA
jgi:predicted TIM-barrel fold metal-dependent hydrolase